MEFASLLYKKTYLFLYFKEINTATRVDSNSPRAAWCGPKAIENDYWRRSRRVPVLSAHTIKILSRRSAMQETFSFCIELCNFFFFLMFEKHY